MKHRHGPVTDCHRLPTVPMVPIVPQSAPMVSVADASVKLYKKPDGSHSRELRSERGLFQIIPFMFGGSVSKWYYEGA